MQLVVLEKMCVRRCRPSNVYMSANLLTERFKTGEPHASESLIGFDECRVFPRLTRTWVRGLSANTTH